MGLRDGAGVPGEAGLGGPSSCARRSSRSTCCGPGLEFTPLDGRRCGRSIDPLKERGPAPGPVGHPPRPRPRRPGLRPAEAVRCSTRSSAGRRGRRSCSAARRPTPATPRSSPTTAPTSRRSSTSQPLLDGEIFSCYSMTEPHAGADPTLFTTRADAGRRRVGASTGWKYFSSNAEHRVVPHRHGGDRPRRERVPGHVDVPGPDRHARAWTSSATSASAASRRARARTRSSTTTTSGCRPTPCSAARARRSPSPRPGSAAAASTTPCARSASPQKALDMMCERALSREAQGGLLAEKQFVQGYIADSYAQLDAVPAVRAPHRVDDRQAQRLPQGAQGHRRGEGAHADRAPRHRAAGHPGPRRPRREQRDAVPPDAPRRRRHGPGRRPDRGPQGHRRPPGPARPPAERRPLADASTSRSASRRRRPSSPSSSSTRSATCDRRRPASTRWLDDDGPARQGRAARAPVHLGRHARTRSTSCAAASSTAALRIPPADRARDAGRGDPPRVAHHRGPRRHRRPPHPGHRACAPTPTVLGPHLLPDGLRRRLVADGHPTARGPAPFDTDLEARQGLAYQLVEGIALLSKVDWQAKGLQDLGRPDGFHERQVDRWTAFLERIKGRELPGFDEAVGLAAGPPADRLHPRPHARRLPVRQRHVPPRRPGPAGGHRRLGDGHGRRPQARPRLGRALVARGHQRGRRRRRRLRRHDGHAVARRRCSQHYAEVSGRQVDDIDYYFVLAKWKLAVVLEQGFQRAGDDEKLLAFGPDRARADAGRGRAGRDHRLPATDMRAAVCRVVRRRRRSSRSRSSRPPDAGAGRGAGAGGRGGGELPRRAARRRRVPGEAPRPVRAGQRARRGGRRRWATGVDGLRVGDRVFGTALVGAFAEEAVVAARRRCDRRPPGSTTATAAAFGVAHRTAFHVLRSVARAAAGRASSSCSAPAAASGSPRCSSAPCSARRSPRWRRRREKLAVAGAHGAAHLVDHRAATSARRCGRRCPAARTSWSTPSAATWPSRRCARCAGAGASSRSATHRARSPASR